MPGESHIVVATHCCVKQKSDQIKTILTPCELMDVYDVQTTMQELILNLKSLSLQKLVVVSITKAIPEKILYHLISQV